MPAKKTKEHWITDEPHSEIIIVRPADSIFQAEGQVEQGTFHGLWHFSSEDYYDRDYTHFGTLRLFNDDTLSAGATWPPHPHRNVEVVTYCVDGIFRHADERGEGGILRPGWIQHTTAGRGMSHSEINDRPDAPVRFIQMWFMPAKNDLEPSLEQKRVEREDRTNRLLPIVSNEDPDALLIVSDARVFASYLKAGNSLDYGLETGRGAYLYVVDGGPVSVNGHCVEALGAAKIIGCKEVSIVANDDAELLIVEVPLAVGNVTV